MGLDAPTVTVIIATYNKSSVLRYAIDSVLWQTFRDFELWVIGDACTDNSERLVGSYDDPRVHWYNLPENTGYQSGPNNEGLRRARGEYVAYLNHDDLWLPNHLQVLVDCIESTGADFVYSILEFVGPGGAWQAEIPGYPWAPIPPHASATLHRRDVIEDLGYWKQPSETPQFPRVAYFREAELVGKRFGFAPFLTVLMFARAKGGAYASAGPQAEYIARITKEPDFAHKELGTLLAQAYWELDRLPASRRLLRQLNLALSRVLLKRGVNPAAIRFWMEPGKQVKRWRARHGLESL